MAHPPTAAMVAHDAGCAPRICIAMDLGNLASLSLFLPELLLTAGVIVMVVADLILRDKRPLGDIALILTAGALVLIAIEPAQRGAWLFHRMLVFDAFAVFFRALIALAALVAVWMSIGSVEVRHCDQGEYYAILLASTLGMFLMAEATNLLMAYLALEFVSLTSYILTGFLRRNRRSQEAALKYLIYGGVASGMMLYGMSWIFGIAGSFDFGAINTALNAPGHLPVLTVFVALVLMLAGLGYKIASVPFRMWAPDVYTGAPIPITTFLAVRIESGRLRATDTIFLSRDLAPGRGGNWQPLSGVDWPQLLLVVCVITMTLGNLAALQQTNMKRLLAYSSIAQAGYALMGIVILTNDGIRAMLFYLFAYYVMDAGAFLVVMIVANATGREDLEAYRGLAWRGGAVPAIALAIFLLSFDRYSGDRWLHRQVLCLCRGHPLAVLPAGGDRSFEFDSFALLLHGADQDDVPGRAAGRRDASDVRALDLRPDGRAGVRDRRLGIVLDADHFVRGPFDALLHRPVVKS